LVFCQRVMTSLGGSVSVASEPGAGARITLHFPVAKHQEQVEDSA
jgi:two-component system, response regulator PhcR